MLCWIDPKMLLEILVGHPHHNSKIKADLFALMLSNTEFCLVFVLAFMFIHLFQTTKSSQGSLRFSANQERRRKQELLLLSIITTWISLVASGKEIACWCRGQELQSLLQEDLPHVQAAGSCATTTEAWAPQAYAPQRPLQWNTHNKE